MNSHPRQIITITKLFSDIDDSQKNSLTPLNSRPASIGHEEIKESSTNSEFAFNQGITAGLTSIKLNAGPKRNIKSTRKPSK